MVSKIGMENAAVLPVPVWAWPIILDCAKRNSGITRACMGLGVSNPFV